MCRNRAISHCVEAWSIALHPSYVGCAASKERDRSQNSRKKNAGFLSIAVAFLSWTAASDNHIERNLA